MQPPTAILAERAVQLLYRPCAHSTGGRSSTQWEDPLCKTCKNYCTIWCTVIHATHIAARGVRNNTCILLYSMCITPTVRFRTTVKFLLCSLLRMAGLTASDYVTTDVGARSSPLPTQTQHFPLEFARRGLGLITITSVFRLSSLFL